VNQFTNVNALMILLATLCSDQRSERCRPTTWKIVSHEQDDLALTRLVVSTDADEEQELGGNRQK